MKSSLFGVDVYGNKRERTVGATIRILGLDVDVACYGSLDDWVFPFMFVPKLCGFFTQVLGLAVFVGRLKVVDALPAMAPYAVPPTPAGDEDE